MAELLPAVCGYCEFADHCGRCACCKAPTPVVAAVLAVTPIWDGEVLVGVQDETDMGGGYAEPLYGAPEPIAARQVAAVLRALAKAKAEMGGWQVWLCKDLTEMANELQPSERDSAGFTNVDPGNAPSATRSALLSDSGCAYGATSAEVTTPDTPLVGAMAVAYEHHKTHHSSMFGDCPETGCAKYLPDVRYHVAGLIDLVGRMLPPVGGGGDTSTSEDVYLRTARAYVAANPDVTGTNPQAIAPDLAAHGPFRAAVDVAYAAGLAAATSNGERWWTRYYAGTDNENCWSTVRTARHTHQRQVLIGPLTPVPVESETTPKETP